MTRNRNWLPAARRRQGGFTLIEIMLVVLLIGITVTFVNLNLEQDPAQVVRREGDRVAALLRQLLDESTLRGRVMAIRVDTGEQRYDFEVLEGGEWKTLEGDDLFYARRFAPQVTASLRIEGDAAREGQDQEDAEEDDRADGRARVVVNPVGEISPFSLTLSAAGHRVVVGLDEYAEVVASAAGEAQ